MIKKLKRLLLQIIYFGCDDTLDYDICKGIILTNQVCLVFIFFSLPYTYFFHVIGSSLLAVIVFIAVINYAFCLFLNKRKKFLLAKIVLIVTFSVALSYHVIVLGSESGIQFLCFALVLISYVIFEPYTKRVQLLFTVLPGFTFVLLEMYSASFIPVINFSRLFIAFLKYSVIINSFVIMVLVLQFYSNVMLIFKKTLGNMFAIYSITKTESKILMQLMTGKTNKEIANTLFIEETTVKSHLKNIFRKVNVKSRTELMAIMNHLN